MTWFELLITLLMSTGIVVYLAEPLVRRFSGEPLELRQNPEAERLALQKDTLYVAIRDLDFDYHTGKVDDQDYVELRQSLEGEAIETLQALDAVDSLSALDHELEQEILALRLPTGSQLTDENATAVAQEACPHCQVILNGDENFCFACGQTLYPS